MADKKNYYEILGVSKTATEDEIKSAYRKLVKQYHPDLHPGDAECAEKFKEINEANEVLSDAEKRKQYDFQLEHPNMGGAGFSGFSGQGFSGADFSGFSDIFSDIFGGFGGRSSRSRGAAKVKGEDITIEVKLSFLDAAKGCRREISYTRNAPCASCKGTGAKDGTAFTTCQKCNGTGRVQYTSRSGFFTSVTERECDECHGTGRKITEPCPDCKGRGYIKTTQKLTIDIPAGADTGSYMRKAGYGEASSTGGPAGDLIIAFTVEPSKIFRRKQFDLYVDLPISFRTAALGGKVEVPLIDDTLVYDIPEGTQSGKVFYVKGKGIKTSRGSGDLYIVVTVEVPSKLTRDQKAKLNDFADTLEIKQTPKMKDFSANMQTMYGKDPYKE